MRRWRVEAYEKEPANDISINDFLRFLWFKNSGVLCVAAHGLVALLPEFKVVVVEETEETPDESLGELGDNGSSSFCSLLKNDSVAESNSEETNLSKEYKWVGIPEVPPTDERDLDLMSLPPPVAEAIW